MRKTRRIGWLLTAAWLLGMLCGCAGDPAESGVSDASGPASSVSDGTAGETVTGMDGTVHAVYRFEGATDYALDRMSDRVWVLPKCIGDRGGYKKEYLSLITDISQWDTVYAKTCGLKLFVAQLAQMSEEDMRTLADFVREHNLLIEVEVGGIRMAPENVPNDQMGLYAAAQDEIRFLRRFAEAGGRIDYLTTDGALLQYATGRKTERQDMSLEDLARQQMIYYQYMLEWFPNLRCGATEGLGFYRILGAERQYEATDPTLTRPVNFEDYLTLMLRLAEEYRVPFTHFELDFNLAEVDHDGDYGRLLATESFCQKNGVAVGMFAANTFHKSGKTVPENLIPKANQSAAERALTLFEGYMQAGGHSNYLVLQRWQPYPDAMGPEEDPYTSMGIFKSLIESPYFPQEPKVFG